ncbi:cytochrome c oxidase subunit II [Mesorhizobium sp. M7A.F.Ca.MR.362.00.0.0]|uniref:cytochrome c oxidase subunit II n=1 Tax=Mesorhizobium sp. M7A.F.Ca.MR.362.00.0.0 TaxID=2496779 RepID=UPI001FE1BF42|nr:cytochrome c oxidase subunit II [Mesorhizobium sp. M7A.F.Ca.MR.362.00.0.0]
MRWLALWLCLGTCSSCSGAQSALDPAGEEARQIADLFWLMAIAGGLIWLTVIGLLVHAIRHERTPIDEHIASRLIFWGGAAIPSLLLFLLLGYALWLMPGLRPFAGAVEADGLRIEVTGEQFWWRVAYHPADGGVPILSANEIRLPVGERVEFLLKSTDVIHSFWIPALGGKMDMIPGRVNRLSLLATKPGTYRGPCAEYCGTSHALMTFTAVAMQPAAFREWLAVRANPSPGASLPGRDIFLRNGCGACHRVAGTQAEGGVGPDLSHMGSRGTIGAGVLPTDDEAVRSFIAHSHLIKPGSKMPDFNMLPQQDIAEIAAWLKGLE